VQYALLAYGRAGETQASPGEIDEAIAAVLARPHVSGWVRLHSDESATTLRASAEGPLLTDGPFIDSKEYLAGLILIEAENLDRALEIARECQDTRPGGALEVRPVIESRFRAA